MSSAFLSDEFEVAGIRACGGVVDVVTIPWGDPTRPHIARRANWTRIADVGGDDRRDYFTASRQIRARLVSRVSAASIRAASGGTRSARPNAMSTAIASVRTTFR